MAKDLDEIIYEAITANETVMTLTSGRIYSTCIEVPPTEDDNTPLPYVIITDDPYQNDLSTKDAVWEGNWDRVQSSVIIVSTSPAEVKQLRRLIRQAIASYVISMTKNVPYLISASNEGINWDWMRPCYYDTLHYQCDMANENDDNGQEES